MLLCVMGFNECDVFKLVPVLCGYRRLTVATGLLHFFENRLLDRASSGNSKFSKFMLLPDTWQQHFPRLCAIARRLAMFSIFSEFLLLPDVNHRFNVDAIWWAPCIDVHTIIQ